MKSPTPPPKLMKILGKKLNRLREYRIHGTDYIMKHKILHVEPRRMQHKNTTLRHQKVNKKLQISLDLQ